MGTDNVGVESEDEFGDDESSAIIENDPVDDVKSSSADNKENVTAGKETVVTTSTHEISKNSEANQEFNEI